MFAYNAIVGLSSKIVTSFTFMVPDKVKKRYGYETSEKSFIVEDEVCDTEPVLNHMTNQ